MKKSLTIIVLTCFLTISCIPTMFAAGATAGGAILYDQRDNKAMLNDMKLAPQAKHVFSQAPEFEKQSALNFHSYNQTLLITGQVSTPELQKHIDEVSKSIPLAKKVYNQTQVTDHRTTKTNTKDTWITTKAKTMLLAKKGLRSNNFKVITENQVVYLLGMASQSQTAAATHVISKIAGVSKVISLVEPPA
jgi:osmotically-inducible protein OsmY